MKNRKKTLTSLFKIGVLLLGFSLLLWNCQTENLLEDTVIENSSNHQKPIIERLTCNDIENDNQLKQISTEFGISKLINNNNNSLLAKTSNKSQELDFSINTDVINKITKDNFVSYTFHIETNQNKKKVLENLVIEKKGDALKGYFVKYALNKRFLETNQKEGFSGSAEITTYGGDIHELLDKINTQKNNTFSYRMASPDCEDVEIFVETSCPCEGHWPGESCQCQTQPDTDRYVVSVCNGGGTGDFSDGYSGTDSSGGGGSSSDSSTTVITNTYPVKHFEKFFSFEDALNDIPSRFSSVETQFSYLNAVGNFLNLTNFKELGQTLVDVSLQETILNQNQASLMVLKTVETLNLLKTVSNFDQLSLANQNIVAQNSLFIAFLPEVTAIIGDYWPKNDEEWTVIGELFSQFLPELALGFIPGSSIVDVVKGIDQGDIVAITVGIVGVIVDAFGGTILKGISKAGRIAYKVFKSFKLTYKFVKVLGKALKTGLKVTLDGTTVILKKSGTEIARIANNILTFKYSGFGGDIITNPNKTTTLIGRWQNQLENIWNTGLAKQGNNSGGLNVLGDVNGSTIAEKWADNKRWLNEAIVRKDVIRVTANPLDIDNVFYNKQNVDLSKFTDISKLKDYLLDLSPDLVEDLGYYGREIRHLFQNGYSFNSTTKQFIK